MRWHAVRASPQFSAIQGTLGHPWTTRSADCKSVEEMWLSIPDVLK
jgi:hypothetical protein